MSAGEDPVARLASLGLVLPEPPPAAAAYVPVAAAGGTVLFTAGQLPVDDGRLLAVGTVGSDVDLDTAVRCARQCALNALAQVDAHLAGRTGGHADTTRAGAALSGVQVVKVTVFVASAPGFTDQHLVADGASRLLADVLGRPGVHARSAVGVAALPLGAPVEVEAVLSLPVLSLPTDTASGATPGTA